MEQGTGLRTDSQPSFAPPQEYPRCYASEEVLTHHPQRVAVERQNVLMREHS
jgi:hypothetical protein